MTNLNSSNPMEIIEKTETHFFELIIIPKSERLSEC